MRDGSLLFRWEDAGTWSSARLLGRITPKQQQVAELKFNLAQHSPEVWKGGLEQGYKYRSALHAVLQAESSMIVCAGQLAKGHSALCSLVVPQSSGTAYANQQASGPPAPCTSAPSHSTQLQHSPVRRLWKEQQPSESSNSEGLSDTWESGAETGPAQRQEALVADVPSQEDGAPQAEEHGASWVAGRLDILADQFTAGQQAVMGVRRLTGGVCCRYEDETVCCWEGPG